MSVYVNLITDKVSISISLDGRDEVPLSEVFDMNNRLLFFRRENENQKQNLPPLELKHMELINQLELELDRLGKNEEAQIKELILNYLKLKSIGIVEKYEAQLQELFEQAKKIE